MTLGALTGKIRSGAFAHTYSARTALPPGVSSKDCHQSSDGQNGWSFLVSPCLLICKSQPFFFAKRLISVQHTLVALAPTGQLVRILLLLRARLQIANVSRRKSQMSSRLTLRYHRYRGFGFCLRDGVNVLGATVNGLKKKLPQKVRKVCAAWSMVLGFWGTLFGY